MAITGVAFTLYPVSDLDRAIAFYRDTLGIPFGMRAGSVYAEFTTPDGATFGTCKLREDMRAKTDFPMNVGEPGTGKALALAVDDLKATVAELASKGVTAPEATETPVCWMTTIEDPDGNRITLHQQKST